MKSYNQMKMLWCLCAVVALPGKAQNVTVSWLTPRIVHVVKTPENHPVTPADTSLVVIAAPQSVKVKLTTPDNHQRLYTTSQLVVRVDDAAHTVRFERPDGTCLLQEGSCAFTPITEGIDEGRYKVMQSFALDADEPIYGVGMLQNGKMSQRGEHRRMLQSNLEDYTHFFQSIKGYGIYWDNYSPTQLDDDGTLSLESEVGQKVDYYFMYGGDADGVIKQMRHLTGEVPMLPLWTYGFHQSRERYKSQQELLDVVHTYREKGIPFDGIIQDWQYWGSNYTWNAMDFINEDFSRPQQMIDEVHHQHAHFTISIWASFGPQTLQYRELNEKGLLFDFQTWPQSGLGFWPPRMDYPSGVKVYDCYSPEARDIYWKYLSRMHKMGVDGWWMDSTDPDHHSFKEADLDEKCSAGSYRSVRNLFPFMTVGGVDEHQRAEDREKRVFILTRSFFAGQQRYGANTWSGDVNSSWDSFRKQVPLCLNHTLTANPNVNTDIGGFFAGSYNTQGANSAMRNPQFRELYVRWMQFGLFCPMMRSHGTDAYRELYYYGNPGEPVYDALVNTVKMRYRLLPYIYSQSWQVSKNDDSFMRALFMDFKEDPKTWDNGREFLFGHSLLVCPVTDPLYTPEKIVRSDAMTGWNAQNTDGTATETTVDWTAKKHYTVYLPKGADWYDYWTGTKYTGGQDLEADAPLAHSPLYVKSGSILPIGQDLQYSNEKSWDNITLQVYPGRDATFTLYEDEGDGYGYQQGSYTEIPMVWNERTRTLTIGTRKGTYPGMLKTRTFRVGVVGAPTQEILYTGKAKKIKL